MRLVASLVIRNELGRYLPLTIASLQDFCDEIRILDDASTDGSFEYLAEKCRDDCRVEVIQLPQPTFDIHEGRTRQALLEWTLEAKPTHVLSIDADEFISDEQALRDLLEREPDEPVWSLAIQEVWETSPERLGIREDGGWRTHPLSVLWRAPEHWNKSWQMLDRKLACRRVPIAVLNRGERVKPSGVDLLHFGWANPAERQARWERYDRLDGGRYHASQHLASIQWPRGRMTIRGREWPDDPIFQRLRVSLGHHIGTDECACDKSGPYPACPHDIRGQQGAVGVAGQA